MVITTGSVQGSEGMYVWLAQDLAERGYVVLTYDVQGQGTSETLPHETSDALPFCNPFAEPRDGEQYGCPGVPFQQLSNFVVGTEDAIDFFMSTPDRPYANPGSAGATVTRSNPYARWFNRSKDETPSTPGRRTKLPGDHRSLDGRRCGLEGPGHRPPRRRRRGARQAGRPVVGRSAGR